LHETAWNQWRRFVDRPLRLPALPEGTRQSMHFSG
jgi:hypothetical protein